MQVVWAAPALKRISQIKSRYFSVQETNEYRIRLIERIEEKILQTGALFKSRNYKNTYIIYIDRFIVSFKLSDDRKTYTITALKHVRQNQRY